MDAEWDKRTNQKKEKKDKQFKEKLKGKAWRQVALRCISVLRLNLLAARFAQAYHHKYLGEASRAGT